MVRGATVRGPTGTVDALPSAPRTLAGGLLATVLALFGFAALAYPTFGLAVGAVALGTALVMRRRRSQRTRRAASEALTARERAGDVRTEDSPADDDATDTGASTRCEAAD